MAQTKKPNRKGVFIGAYIDRECREFVVNLAKSDKKTISDTLQKIIRQAQEAEKAKNRKFNPFIGY